jgi:hypothetical protein
MTDNIPIQIASELACQSEIPRRTAVVSESITFFRSPKRSLP